MLMTTNKGKIMNEQMSGTFLFTTKYNGRSSKVEDLLIVTTFQDGARLDEI